MRGRVKVSLLLLSLLFATPVLPQCSWTPRASAQFRDTALDVAAGGGFLWLATGYGITLIDATTLLIADSVALPGNTRVIHVDPRGVAYAGSGSRLYVLARNNRDLSIVRWVDAGGTVNDIAAAGTELFVATSNGLFHFDALEATNPIRAANALPTTSSNVTSVAVGSGRLYAADGDASVDFFSITIPSLPQRTGELATTIFRPTTVHTNADDVFVSDALGQNTELFTGSTRIAQLATGTNAFAAFVSGVHFAAGNDRTLRMIDFTSTTAVKEVREHQLAPTGGTDNVIHEIVRSGNHLYVAAGDIGLVVFDIANLAAPFPIASYRTAPTTSTVMNDDRAWFADATGVITEQKIVASGISMTTERTWSGGMFVHDTDGTKLLTSNGASASIWSLAGTPAQTHTSTFRAAVKAARFHGDNVVALLVDGSVWRGGATPQQVSLPNIAFMDRAGTKYVFAELRDTGSTVLHHFASGDFAIAPVTHSFPGIATVLAMDDTRVAAFTFEGIRIVNLDFSSGRTIPVSGIPRHLAFSGADLVVLFNRTLSVYTNAQILAREHALPADALMVDAAPSIAAVATIEGTMAVSYLGSTPPAPVIPYASRYYTKVLAAGDRTYLFGSDGIDTFSTTSGELPHYMTTISAAGIVDVAALPAGLFTLSASNTVTLYSPHGVAVQQMTINEGADAQPIAIDVAGNALWVSISKGCLSGGCQNKTLVMNPATLAITSTMNGAVLDVVTGSNNRAYALFELPTETRVLNILDPLQPSQMLAIPSPNRASSITAHSGRVLVLGDRLYEYTENTMVLKATHLPAITPDKAQQVRVDGNCLLITGRNTNPETYNATTLMPAPPQHDVPSNVRSVALLPGRLLLLTTHSLEVWASGATESPKRRTVR